MPSPPRTSAGSSPGIAIPPVAVAALWQNQLSAVGLALVEIFDRHAAAITAPA